MCMYVLILPTTVLWPLCRSEGRSWYTTHRGRLWIAAAAEVPTADKISSVEKVYKTIYQGRQPFTDILEDSTCFCPFKGKQGLKFPSDYPTSCLLGSVDVVDCLARDDYVAKVLLSSQCSVWSSGLSEFYKYLHVPA